ncbi:MAG: potassium channel protein [Chloroflexi bacterium]|nr:MAG: potassium channel protein [Chloroflexota bacterium]
MNAQTNSQRFKHFRKWIRTRPDSYFALILVPVLILVGTVAYILIERWSLADALYATVVTVTTVGYGDFTPVTPAGRIFTTFFILAAVGVVSYAISTLAAFVIQRQKDRFAAKMQERKMKQLAGLQNHVILCGGGAVGTAAIIELRRTKVPVVLVESNIEALRTALLFLRDANFDGKLPNSDAAEYFTPQISDDEDASPMELAAETGVLYLQEDPTQDRTLVRAGLSRARALIAALDTDKDNLFVVLSARQLAEQTHNSRLQIISRLVDENNRGKLHAAGANRIHSLDMVGGVQMALSAVHPEMSEFWQRFLQPQNRRIQFETMAVSPESELAGKTVAQIRAETGKVVVIIRHSQTEELLLPEPDTPVQPGQTLIVLRLTQ